MKLSPSSVERTMSVFAQLDVGDPRRRERVLRTVEKLASNPRASFPEAMGSEAAVEGAYRLMSSPHVTGLDLNEAHASATAQRARAAGRVLAIHDTTSFEFGHLDPKEVGYLNTGKAGFLVHYALVVALDELRPLGIGNVEVISRTKAPSKRSPRGAQLRKRSAALTVKDADRESLRWFRGFDATDRLLEGTDVVHVADREGDNYELIAQATAASQRFVIRVRVLDRKVEGCDGEFGALKTVVEGARGALKREVSLSSRKPKAFRMSSHADREARMAKLEFSATRVVLSRPKYQDKELLAAVELNVVRVFEPRPPADETPIEWVLFTTEPIATADDVAAVVDIYRARWLIEECNKAIKTGCNYEARHFESLDALLTLLGMTFPIAIELLWLRAACRRAPDRPATEVLTPVQLAVLRRKAARKLSPTATVRDALWAIAGLGGHLRTNGEPGWLVLHRGMAKLLAYVEGYEEGQAAREPTSDLSISG